MRRIAPLAAYLLPLTLLVLGCKMSLSPVKNRIGIGVEPYVIFDGDGEDGQGDLYAASTSGGSTFRLTFSRAHESNPALSPNGAMLAFIRGPLAADSSSQRVWIMNLLNGSERELPAINPRQVAWSRDGSTLFVTTPAGVFAIPAPPVAPSLALLSGSEAAAADSALAVQLGDPVIAIVEPCHGPSGLCASGNGAEPQRITDRGRAAFRWGADSVGYFVDDVVEVRPLGGGTTRQVRWANMPAHPRTATHFSGRVAHP